MSSELRPGTVVDGRFTVGPLIGEGGFGLVYRAADQLAGRDVAFKTLKAEALQEPDLVRRFRREARISGTLSHPNTARLLGVGALDGEPPRPYLVFELVRGLPLGHIADHRGALGLDETVAVLVRVLESLGEAHEAGVLHRDIKPNNVIVVAPSETWRPPARGLTVSERLGVPPLPDPLWRDLGPLPVKVLDFGLAKLLARVNRPVTRLTDPGTGAGTAEYMSPEQAEGAPDIDLRSDLYGVGMLLYRLLIGRSAYEADTPVDVALMQVTLPLPPMPAPWDHHPVAAVFRRACAKRRDARYGSAAELATALRRAAEPGAAADPEPIERPPGLIARLFRRR